MGGVAGFIHLQTDYLLGFGLLVEQNEACEVERESSDSSIKSRKIIRRDIEEIIRPIIGLVCRSL